LRKRSHFGTAYCKIPPLKNRKINGDQEGCMLDLEPSPGES